MLITADIAQPIVDEIMKVIDYNVNIMNEKGIIVASGDSERTNQVHQGALEAIELKRERIIHTVNDAKMVGTSAGVNVPIVIKERIVGVVGITGDPKKIYKFIHIIKITVETLLEQQLLIEQLRFKQTALEDWIHKLRDKENNDLARLENEASYLSIDLAKKCKMIAVQISNFNASVFDYEILHQNETQIFNTIKQYFPFNSFVAGLGKGMFVVCIVANREFELGYYKTCKEFSEKLKTEGFFNYIGIGGIYEGIFGYRTSLLEAIQSIDILKQSNSKRTIAHISDWGTMNLVAQIPKNYRQTFITSFLNQKPPLTKEIEETLQVFLSNNLNLKKTALEMHIHRNTLIYRLDKIKESWGLDPRKFSDALNLQMMIWCKMLTEK
ncbi:CdaR family transcriptional regulator [Sporosarcina cascadiensis]|uniref:CdaR family transcriptional regulator n=1 Tax=Sporosarcina cascadiensis TaxID=2660747 RepID=UPI00129B3349|nr:sugar diacid recognition domain-containing protein [Sporosarcina cascadiensis]